MEKKLCCSKKIVLASYVLIALLTLATLYGSFCTERDMTAVSTVATLAWAETAAANAFYFWKAKNENRIKLTNQMVHDLAAEYGIDAVATLAGIVLKD
jgi:alcohol dehydrogenase YqhD (iron-dependent ADH family)